MTIREAKQLDVGDCLMAMRADNNTYNCEFIVNDRCVVIETFTDDNGYRAGDGVVFNDTTGREHYADFTYFKLITVDEYATKR